MRKSKHEEEKAPFVKQKRAKMSRGLRSFCCISECLALNALEFPLLWCRGCISYTCEVRGLGELDLAGRPSAVAKKQGMGDCPT